jgi:hypothetical protein
MRLTKKRLLLIGTVLIVGVFALLPFGPYRERNSYRCSVCFAKKDSFRWWVGSWHDFAIPISKQTEVISQAKFGERFLPAHKVHQWEFAQGSPYYWGRRWGGCALGSGRHVSQIFETYESIPEFRELIQEQIRIGALNSNTFIAIISDTARGETPLQKQGDELMDRFFSRR